jgi:tryptophan-rich sensory protein
MAGLLFIPYAAWCTFATYLAYNFWRLNPKETVAERKKAAKKQ